MPGTHPQYFGWGDVNGNIPLILLRTFGYSRPILVALRSLSLKPFSFGYKTPPIRFSQSGGQSAHKARPPNLQLALTPLKIHNFFRRYDVMALFDCTADLVGQLNGNGQKGMLQIDALPVGNFWLRHC